MTIEIIDKTSRIDINATETKIFVGEVDPVIVGIRDVIEAILAGDTEHVHTNKALLDLVTAAYTIAEETKLAGIEGGAEVNNISDVNATDLTDGGESTLHYHDSDRDRANHTGAQTADTISDFDTEVSNNTDVAANTTHRNDSTIHLTATQKTDLTDTGLTDLHRHTTENISYKEGVAHLDTLQEFINHVWSAGSGSEPGEFELTENGDGTVNITGGVFVLRTAESDTATLKPFTVPSVTNLALTDNATNYIQVDYNNGSPIITASTNLNDVVGVRTKTSVYAINRLGLQLNIVDIRSFNVDFIRKNSLKDYKVHGFEHAGGAFISDLGNRNIAISASEFYLINQAIPSAALDTSATGVFEYVYRDGAGGWSRVASQTQIDNVNYDNGSGTLAAVGNNKYYAHYVYLVLNTPSHYKVIYGQETYNTLEEVEAEAVPSILPSDLDPLSTGVFIGKIIVQQGVDSFVAIQSPFTQILASAVANNHANLAGLQGGKVGEYYHVTASQNDLIIINEAGQAVSSFVYDGGGKLTNVNYTDNADFTNNSKTLNYTVEDLTSTVHTFDYLGQTWTVTTTLSYTGGKLTGKSTTIGKV